MIRIIELKIMLEVSIIIPSRKINAFITKKIIPALKKLTYKKFELIIVIDKSKKKYLFPSFVKEVSLNKLVNPADKRDLGAKIAKGNILAFIDDDVYPHKDWLTNAVKLLGNKEIAAVCGPGVTPNSDNFKEKVSGWVWSSWIGAGGAGVYRCQPGKKRLVDDYPTFNLIVRKKDFEKIGGFKTRFWPGEDTKLCHDLVYKLGKKIIYDPKVLVYHHRREIFMPHLRQISRFGLHRGYFVKILPKTSLKIGYLVPSFFLLFIVLTPFLYLLLKLQIVIFFYIYIIVLYFLLIFTTSFYFFIQKRDIKLSLLFIPAIILTHLVYAAYFIKGLISRNLKN